jgi:hypothetical protein
VYAGPNRSGASRDTLPRRSEAEPFWSSFSHGLRLWLFSQFQLSIFRRRREPVAPAARERGATGSEGRLRDRMLFDQSRLGTMLMLNKPG